MRSNRPAFKSSAFTARTSTTSESASLTSVQLPSDNLYNKSFLLESGQRKQRPQNSTPSRTPHQRRSATDTPIHAQKTPSSYGSSQLGNQEQQTDIHRSKKKSYRKLLRSENNEIHRFNSASYCVTYCIIIIIGVTIGGWIGGLFELISGSYNGCNNVYRGNSKCNTQYASPNVIVHCINTFYKRSNPDILPYICLCRFRNISTAKYRDCEFLHAKIQ